MNWASKQGWSGENKLFSGFLRQYLENGDNLRPKLILLTIGKLLMRFRLASSSMTLDDLLL